MPKRGIAFVRAHYALPPSLFGLGLGASFYVSLASSHVLLGGLGHGYGLLGALG